MPVVSEKAEFKLAPKQIEAIKMINGRATHNLLVGGSRSMKTFTLIRATSIRAIFSLNSRHLIGRFRLSHLKSSIVYDTFPKVMKLCFPEMSKGNDWDLNKADMYAEFASGSTIWFGGLDDKDRTEKILGNEYATIFLNECSQIPFSTRSILMTRLAQDWNTRISACNRRHSHL